MGFPAIAIVQCQNKSIDPFRSRGHENLVRSSRVQVGYSDGLCRKILKTSDFGSRNFEIPRKKLISRFNFQISLQFSEQHTFSSFIFIRNRGRVYRCLRW